MTSDVPQALLTPPARIARTNQKTSNELCIEQLLQMRPQHSSSYSLRRIPEQTTQIESDAAMHVSAIEALIHKADSEISGYLRFEPGWDGYFGAQFDEIIVKNARVLLSRISAFLRKEGTVPAEIIPGPASDGSIDIEIITASGKRMIFTLDPQRNSIAVARSAPGFYKMEDIPLGALNAERSLSWLAY